MNKGAIIVGVGGVLALLGIALVASADEKPKLSKPPGGGGTIDIEDDSGQDVCDGYLATIKSLKGVRAALKAQLVDVDAELMALYQNGNALPEYVAQVEGARKALQSEIAAKDSQIAVYQAQLEEECG